jgi:hypothetical protein
MVVGNLPLQLEDALRSVIVKISPLVVDRECFGQ